MKKTELELKLELNSSLNPHAQVVIPSVTVDWESLHWHRGEQEA